MFIFSHLRAFISKYKLSLLKTINHGCISKPQGTLLWMSHLTWAVLALIKKTAYESAWLSDMLEHSRNSSPGTYHKYTPAPHKSTSTGHFYSENFTSFLSHKDDGQKRDGQICFQPHLLRAAGYDTVFFNMVKSICCSRERITSLDWEAFVMCCHLHEFRTHVKKILYSLHAQPLALLHF